MGTLAKTTRALEDRVGLVRKEFEPRVGSRLKEARAEWAELKSRQNKSRVRRTELRLKASLIRADATIEKLIRRSVLRLEKVKRALPRYR